MRSPYLRVLPRLPWLPLSSRRPFFSLSTSGFSILRVVLLLVLLLLTEQTIYVDVNGKADSTQSGTVGEPCLSISCALRLVSSGETVSVAKGRYTGPLNSNLNITRPGRSNVKIIGQGNTDEVIILSTVSSARAFVVINNAIDTIQNITIRDFSYHPASAYLSKSRNYVGGAISISATNLTLANVAMINNSAVEGGAVGASRGSRLMLISSHFIGNSALSGGGALSINLGSLNASRCTFELNTALGNPQAQTFGDGGAVLAVGGVSDAILFSHTNFLNNSAAEAGGAVHLTSVNFQEGSFTLEHSRIAFNTVTGEGRCLSSTLCDVRGGAIFSSVPSSKIHQVIFEDNQATTSAVNQFAQGGALYSTSVYSDISNGLTTEIGDCEFRRNYASGSGGALYLLNQQVLMKDCQLSSNVAGSKGSLFSDASTSGGALWYSAPGSQSLLQRVNFTGNYVWGGWGGAIFGTDSPAPLRVVDCDFSENTAFSSYTFVAQGGAVMISHNSIAIVENSRFANNSASPRADISEGPFSLSGSGGAIYVHSANITINACHFLSNFALTGQFDSGSSGGAVLIEDSSFSIVQASTFINNGAAGYLGYSTYASSGSAGALIVKFSSALVSRCNFTDNWVSVGGTQLSSGGAVAVFFDYTKQGGGGLGVQIEDSLFLRNVAFGQICSNSGTAGQGGAVAVIGSSRPGVIFTRVNFTDNSAVSRTGFVLSFGGALAVAVASNVTGIGCRFQTNTALYGLGNDVSAVAGDSDYDSSVSFRDTTFAAASGTQVVAARKEVTLRQIVLCAALKRVVSRIEPSKRTRRRLEQVGYDEVRKAGEERRQDVSFEPLPAWLTKLHRRELKLEHEWKASGQPSMHSYSAQQLANSLSFLRTDALGTDGFDEVEDEGAVGAQEWGNNEDVNLFSPLSLSASSSTSTSTSKKDGGLPAFYHYPSVVITSGAASLINPTFEGNYHVFLGDLLSLFYGDSVPSGGSCVGSIYGKITQTSLTLTVFRAKLTVANFVTEGLELRKLTLMNGTLFVGNNVTVSGNSSIISSTISGILDLTQLQGAPISWIIANRHPTLKFRADLCTGFNLVDIKVLENVNPKSALALLAFPPSITIDSCLLKIYKTFEVDTPRQRVTGGAASINGTIRIYMTNKALLNVTASATLSIKTTTVITAESSSLPALVNMGNIVLDGAKGVASTGDDTQSDDRLRPRETQDASSLAATLTVHGQYVQGPHARLVVTLNNTGQTKPVLSLVSNSSLLGTISVNFLPNPGLMLYDGKPSSWALVSYSEAHPSSSPPAKLSSPGGLGFSKHSNRALGKSAGWTDTYVVDAIACGDVVDYYSGVKQSQGTLYPCFVCLSNSSCSYCSNNICMDKNQQCSGAGGSKVLYESSCCADNCNAPNGNCVGSTDHTQFYCSCTPFYTGDTCKSLSNISIVLITLAGALIVVVGILFYSYRSTLGRKTQVLEELRQGLLFGDRGLDRTMDRNRSTAINEAYLQQLQQGLILKDVSVKWKEIEIEKQVGEGSFGVVYKAVFRGASVAVKKMRPQFSQLTPRDIEEFNKEAYMMSRLRHPNIVLVMGISFVDQEILPMPRRSSIADRRDGFADDDTVPTTAPKHLPKTVCIVTEYLEQGSLADILYGPHRLPAEIWTYDLILTCALQAARGMLYLHTHSPPICHRDLKSSNLVVDDHWVVKVTDFGMSRILPEKIRDQTLENLAQPVPGVVVGTGTAAAGGTSSPDRVHASNVDSDRDSIVSHGSVYTDPASLSQQSHSALGGSLRSQAGAAAGPEMTSNLGTTAWCAPELLTSSSTTRYSIKVDVYSFGMVLWELWEKKRPYDELTNRFDIMDAVRAGRRPPISESCPPAYRSLMQRCWQAEPGRRPNFQYIVRYLKDELARVKRQRERQFSSSMMDGPYSYFGVGQAFAGGRDASISVDSSPGKQMSSKFAQLLPWNRTGREGGALLSPIAHPHTDPIPPEYYTQHGVDAPNLAYLAASPAVSSPFFRQAAPGLGAPITVNGSPSNGDVPLGGGVSGSPRNSASAPSSGGGTAAANQWRDKYVMRFSGWKASQPDAGLPPSALTPAGPLTSPFPGAPSRLPTNGGGGHGMGGAVSPPFGSSPVVGEAGAQGQPLVARLSNNAVILDDQNGLFNIDDTDRGTGSYQPPTILGDQMLSDSHGRSDGNSSPIIRVTNSGSGSGRWSRDPEQPVARSPNPPTRSQSRGSNSF